MSTAELWRFFPVGYLFTIALETPVLLVGLSARHSLRRKLFAGAWPSACTYPVVILVLPPLFESKIIYLLVAETFAPVAECALFWLAFGEAGEIGKRSMWRDFAAIVAANLTSFTIGEIFNAYDWFGLFIN